MKNPFEALEDLMVKVLSGTFSKKKEIQKKKIAAEVARGEEFFSHFSDSDKSKQPYPERIGTYSEITSTSLQMPFTPKWEEQHQNQVEAYQRIIQGGMISPGKIVKDSGFDDVVRPPNEQKSMPHVPRQPDASDELSQIYIRARINAKEDTYSIRELLESNNTYWIQRFFADWVLSFVGVKQTEGETVNLTEQQVVKMIGFLEKQGVALARVKPSNSLDIQDEMEHN